MVKRTRKKFRRKGGSGSKLLTNAEMHELLGYEQNHSRVHYSANGEANDQANTKVEPNIEELIEGIGNGVSGEEFGNGAFGNGSANGESANGASASLSKRKSRAPKPSNPSKKSLHAGRPN